MSIPVMHIHLSRCDECKVSGHRQPPTPHTWGSPEDFQYAEAAGQPPPGTCACECAQPVPRVKVRSEVLPFPAPLFKGARIWRWRCPGCATGSKFRHADALKEALAHHWSDACKHRIDQQVIR